MNVRRKRRKKRVVSSEEVKIKKRIWGEKKKEPKAIDSPNLVGSHGRW